MCLIQWIDWLSSAIETILIFSCRMCSGARHHMKRGSMFLLLEKDWLGSMCSSYTIGWCTIMYFSSSRSRLNLLSLNLTPSCNVCSPDNSQGDNYPSVILQGQWGNILFFWAPSKHHENTSHSTYWSSYLFLMGFFHPLNCWMAYKGHCVKTCTIFHKQQLIILKLPYFH